MFGFRPEVIAGTSVGSINAIALAQASTSNEGLAQMRKLRGVWDSLVGPGDFYTVRDWFSRLTRSDSLDLGGSIHVRLEDAIIQFLFENMLDKAEKSTSLATLDPLEARIRTPEMFDPVKLASGIPLRMLCVSLESGRLRYITGDGRFLEDDNRTPVASALVSGAPLQEQQSDFTTAVAAVRTLSEAIQDQKDHGDRETKWPAIARLNVDLQRARWRAEAAFDRLAAANAALAPPVQARVDPVIGALASASIPGIFGPYAIGAEHYVDGGVRDIVPVRTAIQMGATEVLAIICSTQTLPRAGYAGAQNFLDNLLTSLTNITLKEVVEDDLAGRGVGKVPVTVIIPSFDVHDVAVVDMGLIHISMDYGFMRAADVLSPLGGDARRVALALSDAIAWLRTDTHRLSQTWTARDARPHRTLESLRLRKWIIRKLVEARIASGVALPRFATLWFQRWEQGSATLPLQRSPWFEFATAAETTPAVEPYAYVPDRWTYEEEGDLDGLFLIRAGARFRTTREVIAAITGPEIRITLTVPAGTSRHLPAVPVAGTVVAEVGVARAARDSRHLVRRRQPALCAQRRRAGTTRQSSGALDPRWRARADARRRHAVLDWRARDRQHPSGSPGRLAAHPSGREHAHLDRRDAVEPLRARTCHGHRRAYHDAVRHRRGGGVPGADRHAARRRRRRRGRRRRRVPRARPRAARRRCARGLRR